MKLNNLAEVSRINENEPINKVPIFSENQRWETNPKECNESLYP